MTTRKTLSHASEEFPADQKARVGQKTFLKYQSIIGLDKAYLESYWPGRDQAEYGRITGAGGTFGPQEATAGYGEFLGYFMPRKVMCGKETTQAAGTVTKKLAEWLAGKGYIEDTEDEQERAGAAARDLPSASKVLDLLDAYVAETAPARHGGETEDHFWVERVGPGKLWLKPLTAGGGVIGPVPVPRGVTGFALFWPLETKWPIHGPGRHDQQRTYGEPACP